MCTWDFQKERDLLRSQGTLIKNGKQILGILESIQKPEEVAIRHCRAHQVGKTKLELGKHSAKEAAEKDMLENKVLSLIPLPEIPLPVEKTEYNVRDCQLIETVEARFDPQG